MAITKAMKELLQQSSNNVPGRVASRGSNALRLKLVDGKQVMLLNKQGEATDIGKYWFGGGEEGSVATRGLRSEYWYHPTIQYRLHCT